MSFCLQDMDYSGEAAYLFPKESHPANNQSTGALPDTGPPEVSKLQSAPVIALFVLASLVAVIGVIYAYLYVTKINPRPSRARKYMDPGAGDDDATGQGTHLFLFRRSWVSNLIWDESFMDGKSWVIEQVLEGISLITHVA